MFHLDNNSGIANMPEPNAVQSSSPRWFTEGGGSVPSSYPGALWYNMVQAELLNLLSAAGVTPDKASFTQLADAVKEILKQNGMIPEKFLSEIAALGDEAIAETLKNLGLGTSDGDKRILTKGEITQRERNDVLHDIRDYGGRDDWNGSTGTDCTDALLAAVATRPVTLRFPKTA